MENQHRLIKGYRELSPTEIDLMNRVKSHEAVLLTLVNEVFEELHTQYLAALSSADKIELNRIEKAEPRRWAAIAKTHFQEGFMALVRAIAQPGAPA